MALTKLTARARTRGKGPKEFTFDAIGKLIPRNVTGSDGNPIVLNAAGEQVSYSSIVKNDKGEDVEKLSEGFSRTEDGKLVLPEGHRLVEVDDVVVDESVINEDKETVGEVLALFGNSMRQVLIGAVLYWNQQQRDAAAPKAEVKPDELAAVVTELRAAGLLDDKSEAVWRRSVTTGSKAIEMPAIEFAEKTKEVKALRKAQVPA